MLAEQATSVQGVPGRQDPRNHHRSAAAAACDAANGDAVGYSVSPPDSDSPSPPRRVEPNDTHDSSHDVHAYSQHMHSHGYPRGSAADHASQDTAHDAGYSPHLHPDDMQDDAMDLYEYEYEDDGVVMEGTTPDSTYYGGYGNNSPDAEARYWERMQNLPPDQGLYEDGGDGGGYGDYDADGWGYGGYGVSRWGHLEDIAEEGESAGLSGSQQIPGSAGSYQYSRNAHSNSMDQRQWGRNGSMQRGSVSPSPEQRASPSLDAPVRHASPPYVDPPKNGAHVSAHAYDPRQPMPKIDGTDQSAEAPNQEHPYPQHAAVPLSYESGRSTYHSADHALDSGEYGAVQAHAQEYNSDIMGNHAYRPGALGVELDEDGGSWAESLDNHSNDIEDYNHYHNNSGAKEKKPKARTSPVRAAKTQPVGLRPHSKDGGMDTSDLKHNVARDIKYSGSGNGSFMSQKSSASQPVSGKSSKSDAGSPPPRVSSGSGLRRPNSGSGSPTRGSSNSKRVAKRPPFKF